MEPTRWRISFQSMSEPLTATVPDDVDLGELLEIWQVAFLHPDVNEAY